MRKGVITYKTIQNEPVKYSNKVINKIENKNNILNKTTII